MKNLYNLDVEDYAALSSKEENVHRRTHNAVSLEEDPSPHGDEKGVIASMGGVLVSMQGIPRDSKCGNQSIILEPLTATFGDCEMEGEEKDQKEGLIHPYPFQRVFSHGRKTVQCSEERDKSVLVYI